MPTAERDDLAIEVQIDGLRGRIGGKVKDDGERRGDAVSHRLFQLGKKVEFRADRHVAYRGARHDKAEGVDRIAGVRHEDDVARRGDRLREVGQPLL